MAQMNSETLGCPTPPALNWPLCSWHDRLGAASAEAASARRPTNAQHLISIRLALRQIFALNANDRLSLDRSTISAFRWHRHSCTCSRSWWRRPQVASSAARWVTALAGSRSIERHGVHAVGVAAQGAAGVVDAQQHGMAGGPEIISATCARLRSSSQSSRAACCGPRCSMALRHCAMRDSARPSEASLRIHREVNGTRT